jgi:hypothetical protein
LLLVFAAPLRAQESGAAAEGFTPAIYVSLFTGGAWPISTMNTFLDPSFMAGGRAEYAFTPATRAGAQLSFHSFDAERPGTADNEGVIVLSLFGRAIGEWGPYHPFALLGLGAYVSKVTETSGRRWDGGVQFGGGIEMEINRYLAALAGTGLHMVFRGGEQEDHIWIDGYLGFTFRQP